MNTPLNQTAIEHALDGGFLWARMTSGRYWKLRRNGRTQTWKRDTARFRIPVKCGFRTYGEITESSNVGAGNPQDGPDFVVTLNDPNNLK